MTNSISVEGLKLKSLRVVSRRLKVVNRFGWISDAGIMIAQAPCSRQFKIANRVREVLVNYSKGRLYRKGISF